MISKAARLHNGTGAAAAFATAALAALALAAAGCGGDGGDGAAGSGDDAATACGVVVDLSGWRAFVDLGGRIAAGEVAAGPDLEAFAEVPAVTVWRESLAPNVPPPLRVGNWLEAAFRDELGLEGRVKPNADRRAIAASWRWSWERRDRVDSLAVRLADRAARCRIAELVAAWVPADSIPAPLAVYVVPGKPELRWHGGDVVVDAGVVAAGRTAQLERQIAGIVYRNRGVALGPSPLESDGAAAVAHTFRVIRNEGVAAWIEDLPHTHFDPEHPRLGRFAPVPQHFYATTLRTLEVTNGLLGELLADPEALAARGQEYASVVTAGGGLNQGGYGMAALIAGRLGEARLREAARSVPAFVAAYQEAALLNGDDRPQPGAAGHEPWESLGPVAPEVYPGLMAILEREFGPAS